MTLVRYLLLCAICYCPSGDLKIDSSVSAFAGAFVGAFHRRVDVPVGTVGGVALVVSMFRAGHVWDALLLD